MPRIPSWDRYYPAVGYSPAQVAALQQTINAADAELVVVATPMDLTTLMTLNKPVVRARYEFAEVDPGVLAEQIDRFLQRIGLRT
jgi:predicted GTPase